MDAEFVEQLAHLQETAERNQRVFMAWLFLRIRDDIGHAVKLVDLRPAYTPGVVRVHWPAKRRAA